MVWMLTLMQSNLKYSLSMYHTIVRHIYAVASLRWLENVLAWISKVWETGFRTWSSHCDPYPSSVHRMPFLYRECTSLGSRDTRTISIIRILLWWVGWLISIYQSIVIPGNSLCLVGIGVGEAIYGSSLSSKETVQVGANLVCLALTKSVALCASSLEEVGTLLCVSYSFFC